MSVAELLGKLKEDEWRASSGFSADLREQNESLWRSPFSAAAASEVLRTWLSKHQPCIFGKAAARINALEIAVLSESDCSTDDRLHTAIQDARLKWTRSAYEGKTSGLVIALVSATIARAVPDDTMLAIAKTFASMYLEREVQPDRVYHEDVFLEKPGTRRTTWEYRAGVNYFCAQGDSRWWHDHRIPGGMALSINSVGHLVRSARLSTALRELDTVGGPSEFASTPAIDTLDEALVVAMRTIRGAADTEWGKATWLRHGAGSSCPVQLPKDVSDFQCREYSGYYHTDFTLPSEYFRADVSRPPETQEFALDFTYLFDGSLDNPDYQTMGTGRQIRASAPKRERRAKRARLVPRSVAITSVPRLQAALRRHQS